MNRVSQSPFRSALGFLVILVLSLASSPALAQKGASFVAKGERAEALNELFDRCASVGFSGAILAARDGKVLLARGRGDEKRDGGNDAETLFEIASVTKQFTAAAILRLVELKKLKLDDSIAKHLPLVPKDCEGITVRHLLQHTSGIPGSNAQGGGEDLEAVIPGFLAGGPKHQPGTHWEYWNQGYSLLAGIIERKSGKSFAEFCSSELFTKAKMKTACFTGDAAPKGVKIALGHAERGDRTALSHPYGIYGYQYRGMGGAVCSLWDMWTWDRALRGGKALKKESLAELFKPGLEDYALGWEVRKHGSRTVQEHTGSVRGFLADFRRYVEDDGCLVVLLNDDRQAMHRFSRLFERCLFGEDFVAPPPALEVEAARDLIGEYEAEDRSRLVLESVRGALAATLTWQGDGPKTQGFVGAGPSKNSIVFYDWDRLAPLMVEEEGGGRAQVLRLDGRTSFRRR